MSTTSFSSNLLEQSSASAPASKIVGEEQFSQIRKDLTAPTLISTLSRDPDIRSRLTGPELAAFDTIVSEIGTPDEYASVAEYVLRALPYVKMTYASSQVTEPIPASEGVVRMIMRGRFV